MDLKKSFQDYFSAYQKYNEVAIESINKTSKYEEVKASLKAEYIAEATANEVIKIYDAAHEASDVLDIALTSLEMAKLDLLQHLKVVNYVPVVIYLESGGYLVEAKKKEENAPHIIDYITYLG